MRKSYYTFLVAFFIFALFFLLNYLQPLRADDYGRAITDAVNKGFIIYLRGIGSNYFHWTGRISAQALIYLFLNKSYIGICIFVINILNSISFYLFILYSYKIVTYRKHVNLLSRDFLVYFFFFIFVFYQTGFIANVIWDTAAIQYFWGITLLTIFYYYSIILKKESLLFGIFTGISIGLYNEIFVCMSILFCLAYFFERKLYKKLINKGIFSFFISCSIGGVVLFAAPGNYVRLREANVASLNYHTTFYDNIFHLMHQLIFQTNETLTLMVLVLIFLILVFTNKNIEKVKAIIYSFVLIISLFILTPIVKSYAINQRILLIYYAVFFVVVFMQFYSHASMFITKLRIWLKKISWIFGLLLVIQLYIIISIYTSLYIFEKNRDGLVKYYHDKGVHNVYLPCLPAYMGRTIFTDDITPNKDEYNNQVFSYFYNFDSVTCNYILK